MARTNTLTKATTVAGWVVALNATLCIGSSIYPNNSDYSPASSEVVQFFQGYYAAKSSDNATAWLSYFNPNKTAYYDATLGFGALNYSSWSTEVTSVTQGWAQNAPNDRSYPLRILGDITTGAVVYMIDTAGLFGAEIRSLSSVDFLDGKVTRQVDNWDGRGNIVKTNDSVPNDQYPIGLGASNVPEVAAAEMNATANKLHSALSAGNATAASALFSYDAVFEDLTLHLRVDGQVYIQSYLSRALSSLPYGPGTTLLHILGSAQGGGFEWQPNATSPVRYGLTALELDSTGNVTRFTAMWDGSRLNTSAIQALAMLAPTP